MNRRIRIAVGMGAAVLLVAILASTALAQGSGGAFGGMMHGWGGQGYGPGMMGGRGYYAPGVTGCPFFGGATNPGNAQPISLDQAEAEAQQYVQGYANADLVVAHAMAFDNSIYVQVKEKSTGNGAFELLVNPNSGYVGPEPGPNMMWNTKYGHMAGFGGMTGVGGMMGGAWNGQAGPMTVTAEQARKAAQQWLKVNLPGVGLSEEQTQFYGYYTIDTAQNDEMAGMLSVNGYSGQVWYHTWHGKFVSEKEF